MLNQSHRTKTLFTYTWKKQQKHLACAISSSLALFARSFAAAIPTTNCSKPKQSVAQSNIRWSKIMGPISRIWNIIFGPGHRKMANNRCPYLGTLLLLCLQRFLCWFLLVIKIHSNSERGKKTGFWILQDPNKTWTQDSPNNIPRNNDHKKSN